jgi:hypothetical protein
VRQYSYDGNQIQRDERYIEAGQQRKSFAFVTAPHTFLLKVWPIQGRNFSGPEEAKIVDPALRTDGSGEYANY